MIYSNGDHYITSNREDLTTISFRCFRNNEAKNVDQDSRTNFWIWGWRRQRTYDIQANQKSKLNSLPNQPAAVRMPIRIVAIEKKVHIVPRTCSGVEPVRAISGSFPVVEWWFAVSDAKCRKWTSMFCWQTKIFDHLHDVESGPSCPNYYPTKNTLSPCSDQLFRVIGMNYSDLATQSKWRYILI